MVITDSDDSWRLLLLLAGAMGHGRLPPLEGLSQTQWADLLSQCDRHWLSPAAYRALAPHRVRLGIPQPVWLGFKRSYRLSRARTRRADSLLLPVLAALVAAGLPVIVLKGMDLSTQVYDDPSARPMIDADFMVRHADVPAACRIIESFGYRQKPAAVGDPGLANGHQVRTAANGVGTFFIPNGPPIDLHHDLEAPDWLPGIDMDGVWQRSGPARIAGIDVRVLAPEDCLLHLCVHAAFRHVFAVKLLNLGDIPVALSHWGDHVDWPAFWDRARCWRVERTAILTLAFVGQRMGHILPAGAAGPVAAAGTSLAPTLDAVERLLRWKGLALARRWLIRDAVPEPPAIEEEGRHIVARLWRLPGVGSRLRYILKRILPARRELAAWFGRTDLPVWLPLLYPVRLALIARRDAVGILRGALTGFGSGDDGKSLGGSGPEADTRRVSLWLGAAAPDGDRV